MLNRRKSPRRKMVLSVKLSVDKVTHLAHTVDITPTGARLNCTLRTQLQPGTIIGLQRGSRKAEFRVQWIRHLGRDEQQVGIESLEPQSNFWGVDLSDDFELKRDQQTLMAVLSRCSKSVM
jgi:PilZ domain